MLGKNYGYDLGKGSKIKLIIFAEFSANGEHNYFFKMPRKCSECSET